MTTLFKSWRLTALTIAAVPFAAASAFAVSAVADTSAAQTPPSILVFNHQADAKNINVTYAYLPDDGYVAVYASGDDGKASGDVIGYVALGKGDHRNVTIDIGKPLESGTSLWLSLYRDMDGDRKFDAKSDKSYWPDGKPFQNRFEIL